VIERIMCAMSVDLHAMANEAGLEAPDYFAEELNGLGASEREGLVDIEDHLVRVTVSRVLTRFKRRGILSIKTLDEVGVCDVCRLCALSGMHPTNGRWCSARRDTRLRDSSS
jgi:hypothetical protein